MSAIPTWRNVSARKCSISDLLDIELAADIQRLGGILSFSLARRNLAPPQSSKPAGNAAYLLRRESLRRHLDPSGQNDL